MSKLASWVLMAVLGLPSSVRAQIPAMPPAIHEAQGFTLVPPPGWEAYQAGDDVLIAYRDASTQPPTTLRVSLVIDQAVPLDDFGTRLKRFFDAQLGKWTLAGEGFEVIDGSKSYFISVRQDPKGCTCQDLQYYFSTRRGTYVLTFSTQIDSYPAYELLFRQTARSVKILE